MDAKGGQSTAAVALEPVTSPLPDETGPKLRLWTPVGLRYHLAIILTIGTVVLLAYANSFNAGFALDNKFIILEDPRLRETKGDGVHKIFTEDYWWPKAVSGLYRPLTTASYWLNYAVFGNKDQAAGYHWINFFLHWANASLVYFLVLVVMNNVWPAFFVAAIFAVHPVNTESVTNIIGRGDEFAALVVLGGFLFYARSTVGPPKPASTGHGDSVVALAYLAVAGLIAWKLPALQLSPWMTVGVFVALGALALIACGMAGGWARVPYLLGLMLALAFGVFAKENSVVLLGVLGLYDFTFRLSRKHGNWLINLIANGWDWLTKGYLVLIPPLLAMWYVRSALFEKMRPPELPWVDNNLAMSPEVAEQLGLHNDFWTQRFTAIKVIGKYFWLMLWPQSLSPDYSYNQIPLVSWHFNKWEDWKAIVALAAVSIVGLVAIRQYRRNKPVFFFIAFFFITLMPTANLLRIIGSIMAERFLYLPVIGFAGCLVIGAYTLCRRLIVKMDLSEWALRLWLQLCARTVLILFVVGFGVRAFVRNFDWENDVKLWEQAVKAVPNSFKSHKSFAFALYEEDPTVNNINLDRIIEEGEKARKVTDKTQIVLLHLGAYYRLKGDKLAQPGPGGTLQPTPESMIWYKKSADALAAAVPLDKEFNEDNRQKELKRGRDPDRIQDVGNHEIYWNLGLSLMRLSQYQEALDAYAQMRHLSPTNPDAYLSIASAQLSLGRLEDAAISLLQTLLLDNTRQETLRLLVDLYRQLDREGCSVVFQQGQPRLNVDCQLVANHMCAAYVGLVDVFLKAKQYKLAEDTRANAQQQYKCKPEPFDALFQSAAAPVSIELKP